MTGELIVTTAPRISTVLGQGKALQAALAPHPHPGPSLHESISKKGAPKVQLHPFPLGSRCIGTKPRFQAHPVLE